MASYVYLEGACSFWSLPWSKKEEPRPVSGKFGLVLLATRPLEMGSGELASRLCHWRRGGWEERTAAGAREADWVSVGDGSQMGSRLAHSRAVRPMDRKSLLKAYCVPGHG